MLVHGIGLGVTGLVNITESSADRSMMQYYLSAYYVRSNFKRNFDM